MGQRILVITILNRKLERIAFELYLISN